MGLAVEPHTRPTKTVRAAVIKCFAWTSRFSGGRDHGRDRPNRGQSANGGRLRPTICVRVCSNIRGLREVRGGRAHSARSHWRANRVACLRSPKKDLVQRITNVPPESRATHSPLVKWVLKALQ